MDLTIKAQEQPDDFKSTRTTLVESEDYSVVKETLMRIPDQFEEVVV